MRCISCEGRYDGDDAGTCKQCHEDHKAKVAFLTTTHPSSFSDIFLFASDDEEAAGPVPAHKAVLVSRSPVLRAILENEMEETRSATIKIGEVSYGALYTFVNYLYTAEVCLEQQLACDLLVLAEKYQVQHLKNCCEKFLVSNLNLDNSLSTYTFAHQHKAKPIIDAALTFLTNNMDKLTAWEEYAELKEKDPRLVLDIYEAYLSKQVNAARPSGGSTMGSMGSDDPMADLEMDWRSLVGLGSHGRRPHEEEDMQAVRERKEGGIREREREREREEEEDSDFEREKKERGRRP